MSRPTTSTLMAAIGVILLPPDAPAQLARRDSLVVVPRTVVVTPGAGYAAGWWHRAILGADYRDLWTTPIEVPVLDLDFEGGGLTPTQRGGSMQTVSLRLAGANGREYVFRPAEKDFTKGLPPELRETIVSDVAQDQVSGYHPAAAVVVSSLLDAIGVRHPRPRLMVMPDDPRLGEFRSEFAGVLGTFEERPARDFDESATADGALDVISSDKLFDRMKKSPATRVDTRAYLAARLFDVWVGDRDRHRDQWRWGRFSGASDAMWEPIPRDRDMPFARFEGWGPWLVRGFAPQMVTFSEDYPAMVWLNWNAREIDRRLLAGLDRATWDSVASALQVQLSDAVIARAIAQMPPAFVAIDGAAMQRALVRRRDRLPQAAREFYAVLAREVNLRGTDRGDLVEVLRHDEGAVTVSFRARDTTEGTGQTVPYLQRTFQPGETHEVRLYLHKGDDSVLVRGSREGGVLVRVIGGGGDDTVDDVVSGGAAALKVYDADTTTRIVSEGRISHDTRPYRTPAVARAEREVRDWGSWSFLTRGVNIAPGLGVVGSMTHTRIGYAFRHDPWSSKSVLRLDVSLAERRPRLTWDGAFTRPNSRDVLGVRVVASGIELIRYHGLGNETGGDAAPDRYRVFQNVFRVEPRWSRPLPGGMTMTAGVAAQYASSRQDDSTVLGTERPYGIGEFGQVSARLGMELDRRDAPVASRQGYRVVVNGSFTPTIGSVSHPFGSVDAAASTYLSAGGPLQPTLAVNLGGKTVWGDFPFHEAAQLGGAATLRGWDAQRFSGRSSAYGAAELRARVARVTLVAPTDVGVAGFRDVGRVFADGESSDRWHHATGGGVWMAPLSRAYTVSLSLARSRERTGLYLHSGFAF